MHVEFTYPGKTESPLRGGGMTDRIYVTEGGYRIYRWRQDGSEPVGHLARIRRDIQRNYKTLYREVLVSSVLNQWECEVSRLSQETPIFQLKLGIFGCQILPQYRGSARYYSYYKNQPSTPSKYNPYRTTTTSSTSYPKFLTLHSCCSKAVFLQIILGKTYYICN